MAFGREQAQVFVSSLVGIMNDSTSGPHQLLSPRDKILCAQISVHRYLKESVKVSIT